MFVHEPGVCGCLEVQASYTCSQPTGPKGLLKVFEELQPANGHQHWKCKCTQLCTNPASDRMTDQRQISEQFKGGPITDQRMPRTCTSRVHEDMHVFVCDCQSAKDREEQGARATSPADPQGAKSQGRGQVQEQPACCLIASDMATTAPASHRKQLLLQIKGGQKAEYRARREKPLQTSSNKVWGSVAAKQGRRSTCCGMPQMYAPQLLINLPSCDRQANPVCWVVARDCVQGGRQGAS
jgi:hypothetical protein